MTAPWCWMPTEILDALIEGAERRGGRWSEAEAVADLIRKQDAALRPNRPEKMIAYRDAAVRWGWCETTKGGFTEGRARRLMADESRWADPNKATAWEALRRQRKVDAESAHGQRTVSAAATVEADESAEIQRNVSAGSAQGQRKDSDTSAFGSTTTSTTTTTDEKDNAPVPVADAVKPKGKRSPTKHTPKAAELPKWDDLLGAFAELDPDEARNMALGGGAEDFRAIVLRLLRHDADAAILRLRFLARAPGRNPEWVRGEGPKGPPIFARSGWTAGVDHDATAWSKRCPETARAETDPRWRDPGWTPTRTAQATATRPSSKPTEAEIAARTHAILFGGTYDEQHADITIDQ